MTVGHFQADARKCFKTGKINIEEALKISHSSIYFEVQFQKLWVERCGCIEMQTYLMDVDIHQKENPRISRNNEG